MKNFLAYIIGLIINTSFVLGQVETPLNESWDKIIIVDAHGGWSSFHNEFQINKSNLALYFKNKPDSVIRKVDPELINELFISLNNNKQISVDPLLMFDRDSTWLIKNAKLLWNDYLGKAKESNEIDSIAIRTIKDYKKVKVAVWGLHGSPSYDDYPFSLIQIITGHDTLSIYSDGQYPYMLPWYINDDTIYNSKISAIVSKLLPDNFSSNKSRLAGEGFNHDLIDKIYGQFVEDTADFIKARNKYPRQFKKLEEHFKIVDADLSLMESIEWGGLFIPFCLELVLKDSRVSPNIQFSAVFGRRVLPHSTKPIIRNKEELINRLKANPVYQYTLKNENCIGEIHFVNRKSLSGYAKREFLRDVKSNGQKKEIYKGRFSKAIFFELNDNRGEDGSFSRWIFLKDGTIILWQLRGNYLMGLPKEIIENQGYICRIMKNEEL